MPRGALGNMYHPGTTPARPRRNRARRRPTCGRCGRFLLPRPPGDPRDPGRAFYCWSCLPEKSRRIALYVHGLSARDARAILFDTRGRWRGPNVQKSLGVEGQAEFEALLDQVLREQLREEACK